MIAEREFEYILSLRFIDEETEAREVVYLRTSPSKGKNLNCLSLRL